MTPDGFWTDGQIRHGIPVASILSTLARKNRKSVSRSVRSVHALIEPALPSGEGSRQCAYRIGYLKRVTGAEATSPRRPWAAPCHASPGLGRRATVRVPAASKATPQWLGSPVAGSPPAGLCIPRFWRNPRLRSRSRGVSRYHASRRSALCFSTFGEEKRLRRGTLRQAVNFSTALLPSIAQLIETSSLPTTGAIRDE